MCACALCSGKLYRFFSFVEYGRLSQHIVQVLRQHTKVNRLQCPWKWHWINMYYAEILHLSHRRHTSSVQSELWFMFCCHVSKHVHQILAYSMCCWHTDDVIGVHSIRRVVDRQRDVYHFNFIFVIIPSDTESCMQLHFLNFGTGLMSKWSCWDEQMHACVSTNGRCNCNWRPWPSIRITSFFPVHWLSKRSRCVCRSHFFISLFCSIMGIGHCPSRKNSRVAICSCCAFDQVISSSEFNWTRKLKKRNALLTMVKCNAKKAWKNTTISNIVLAQF